jgi:hypothetical protein
VTLAHWITRGTLTVWLDGREILKDTFSKKLLVPFQTTTWDSITILSGSHQLTAAVVGTKGKVYVSEPFQIEASRTRSAAVRIGFKNEALVIRRKEKGEKDSPE